MTQEATKKPVIQQNLIQVEFNPPINIRGTAYEVLSFQTTEDFKTRDIKQFLKKTKITGQSDLGQMAEAQITWAVTACRSGLSPEDFEDMTPSQFKKISEAIPVSKVIEAFFPSD